MTTKILITTYNRPSALERSLPQIVKLGHPSLVVDDGSPESAGEKNRAIALAHGAQYLRLPENRGLAVALNAGLIYWLADKEVEWISYFQDDVDVHPKCLQVLDSFSKKSPVLTGHDALAHRFHATSVWNRYTAKHKWTSAGVHIHATAEFWRGILPIPTYQLGCPKRNGGGRGIGSNVDWWICKDSPQSSKKLGKYIICVPGLVRTFYWKPEDSNWNNPLPTGEEPPLAAY